MPWRGHNAAMTQTIFQLLGGIGLFLMGMVLLTDGLKAYAGDALRAALVRFTGTPDLGQRHLKLEPGAVSLAAFHTAFIAMGVLLFVLGAAGGQHRTGLEGPARPVRAGPEQVTGGEDDQGQGPFGQALQQGLGLTRRRIGRLAIVEDEQGEQGEHEHGHLQQRVIAAEVEQHGRDRVFHPAVHEIRRHLRRQVHPRRWQLHQGHDQGESQRQAGTRHCGARPCPHRTLLPLCDFIPSVDRVLATGTGHGWHIAGIEALALGVMPLRWCEDGPRPR